MAKFVLNWVVRPIAWAIPVVIMGHLLSIEVTVPVIGLIVFGGFVDDVVTYFLPWRE